MVWDSLLRRGYCQGGNGEPQRRKNSLFKGKDFRFLLFFVIFFVHNCCVFSFQRRYTQHYEDTKDQIYFMQTETPTYDANKKARIAASEVSAKTRTNTKVTQYFYRPYLMWKTRQRVDPCLRAVCESTDSVHSDAGIHCIVPTLHDWEIHIWFTVTTHIRSVALLARRNKMQVCVTKLFSCSAPHSHPHILTHRGNMHRFQEMRKTHFLAGEPTVPSFWTMWTHLIITLSCLFLLTVICFCL